MLFLVKCNSILSFYMQVSLFNAKVIIILFLAKGMAMFLFSLLVIRLFQRFLVILQPLNNHCNEYIL